MNIQSTLANDRAVAAAYLPTARLQCPPSGSSRPKRGIWWVGGEHVRRFKLNRHPLCSVVVCFALKRHVNYQRTILRHVKSAAAASLQVATIAM
jgi:hypothetical protein